MGIYTLVLKEISLTVIPFIKMLLKRSRACILEKSYESEIKVTDKPIIIVKDSIEALKNLAMAKLEIYKPKVIAVTGSVGKTSTRDMIYSIISKSIKL